MVSLFKTKRILFAAALLSLLALGAFGTLGVAGMNHREMSATGTAGDCLFMLGETAVCEMSALSHIASWQAMSASLPAGLSTLTLVLLAFFLGRTFLRYLFDELDASKRRLRFLHPREAHALSFSSLFLGSAISPRAP